MMFMSAHVPQIRREVVLKHYVCGALLLLVLLPSSTAAQDTGARSGVEAIHIARSIRESRVQPTEFCAQARSGFAPVYEDVYSLQSTATRASDGLMTNDNVNTIGRLRTCFGTTADARILNFYAEGVLGAVTFTGIGECLAVKPEFPEPGLEVARCFLELRDISDGYVGGQLTTNTMRSRQLTGTVSDPPGYTQPSIATIRLWKRR